MFVEDITAFLDTTTGFATLATLGVGGTAPVVFDNGYQDSLGGLIESSGPRALGSATDLAAVVQGSTITITAVVYRVASIQPDGTGFTLLMLERS